MANEIREVHSYLKPSKVYIPLASTNSKYYDLFVEEGERVLKGEKIAERYGTERTPIFASVSGTVTGIEPLEYYSGIEVDHLVIDNDHKEEAVDFEPMQGAESARNIQLQLEKLGVRGLDSSGIYTRFDFSKPIKHVFVNAVFQNQAFLTTQNDLFFDAMKEVIDGINLLKKATMAEVTVLVDNDLHTEKYQNAGLNVVKVKPKKNTVWHYNAIRKVMGMEIPYDMMEIGVMFTSINSCKAVYDAVRLGEPVTETRLIVMGLELDEAMAVNVKIGTHVRDVLIFTKQNLDDPVFTGSVLNGFTMKSTEFAVYEHISSIGLVLEETDEHVCIKCGLCNDICPVGILPQNIMDAEIRMVEDRLYEYDLKKCIECGLCSYTCPSDINVLEWVRRAKRRVSRG